MTVLGSRQGRGASATARGRVALAVADANWFTTENLFREVDRPGVSTLLLHCSDYRNALNAGVPPWRWFHPDRAERPGVWRRDLVLPSGWMKRFPRLGMRPIARAVRGWQARRVGASALHLVMTYPHYLHLRDRVRPDRTLYYNLDDYTLYWPHAAEAVAALEREAVRRADWTVCVSKRRADLLREAVPEAAGRIRHLPHGAPSFAIAEAPWHRPAPAPDDLAGLPRPLLGYVGTLEDRVDWALLTRVAEAMPGGTLALIGRPGPGGDAPWAVERARCLALPNVRVLGWRGQEALPDYQRAFDISLIPYRTDHPFNQASSPTKIMDAMGTGRPVVSTDLPECRLYARLFRVEATPGAFVDAIRDLIASGSDDSLASARVDWARGHSCRAVAGRLLDLLDGADVPDFSPP